MDNRSVKKKIQVLKMRKTVYVSSLLLFSLGLMIHSQAGAGSCKEAFDPKSFASAVTQINYLTNLLLKKSVQENGESVPEASFDLRKPAFLTLIQVNEELHKGPHNFNRIAFLESWLREFSEREQKLIIEEMSTWKTLEAHPNKRAFIEQISKQIFSISDANTLKAVLESQWSVFLDFHVKDKDGMTVLMLVLLREHTQAAVLSLKDLGLKRERFAKTVLTEIVNLLLKEGADVNAQNRFGETALMFAAERGYKEIVALFLKSGADVNAQNRDGRTALMFAVRYGNAETMDLLLESGADVNAKDRNGETALMKGARGGRSTAAVALLLEKGADDVNVQNRDGITALMIAAENGNAETVDLLLEKGADINAQNRFGETALMIAVKWGKAVMVALLLKEGADVNIQNLKGKTVIMLVADMISSRDRRKIRGLLLLATWQAKWAKRRADFHHARGNDGNRP